MRRALGALLLALVLLPWYRLVAWRGIGPSAEQTLRLGAQYFLAQWAGLLLGVALILVLSRLLPPARVATVWDAARRWLVQPPVLRVGVTLAVLATGLSLTISNFALNQRPILLDGASQLVQARYFAAGLLAGPPLPDPAFWEFQFMTRTPVGWASQYPPGFAVLLALGLRAGAVWLVGPLLLGVAVCLTTLVADRLFPEDRETARLGSALVAASYFLAFHAGSYMNHALAGALVALAVFASLRALDGTWRWALLSGAAVGALFATRPLVAVVLGFFATVIVWVGAPARARFDWREWTKRLAAAAGGAAPLGLAVMAYNARLFGSPFRFGYEAVAGPAHGLGLHTDPFGSPYGLREAVGYTSADLLGLSLDLLQTPLPALVLIGLYLMRAPRLDRGTRLAAAWALLPVGANALYWHHDLFMGPRLLYESAPAWCLLVAGAALHVIRGLPEALPGQVGGGRPTGRFTRTGVAATFALALGLGVAVAGPARLRGYAANGRASGVTLAPPSVDRPALVFVHEDWGSRLGTRLAVLGLRVDSIRAALLGNTTCELERLVRARERSESGSPASAGTGSLPDAQGREMRPLRELVMPSGSTIRTYTGEVLTPECEREAASDYEAVLALPPLLWQGDLPGLGAHGAMYVRDLGPERNAQLLARFPEREPALLARAGGNELRLIPYSTGMKRLWSME
ncbi:MAG: hypothetical protein HY337_10540 [Gemmatimonadetes bacterium]|nr:hypothetical protein [Gemmatimonadota bacterium]